MTLSVRPDVIISEAELGEPFAGRRRFTRPECDFLERAGFLTESYELVDGEIILKVGQNRLHAVVITLVVKWLIGAFGGDFVQCQLPIEVAEADRATNQPEPDASVLLQPVTQYLQSAPGPGQLRLIIEVSDTSLAYDLRIKASLYARASIPDYWVLDAPSRRLIVHREPTPEGYRNIAAYQEHDRIAPLAAPDQAVTVADLLPAATP